MKKLIGFNKAKEAEEKNTTAKKKVQQKEEKLKKMAASHEQENPQKRELFWDGYSDIGYC